MKTIVNNIIPFRGFKCMNLFGVLFVRRDAGKMLPSDYNHEKIHTAQMKETLYVGFYLIYLLEWVIKGLLWAVTLGAVKPYRSLASEQEAYDNQYDYSYLLWRPKYAWLKGIFRVVTK